MNWKEHHLRNSKLSLIIGLILLLGGTTAGLLDIFVFQWSSQHLKTLEFMLPFILFGVFSIYLSRSQKRKAYLLRTEPNVEPSPEAETFYFNHREIMVKESRDFYRVYRYFSTDGEFLLELKETTSKKLALTAILHENIRSFLSRSYVLLDKTGQTRLVYKVKSGLNPPIEVFMPNGEKIASYKQSMMKQQIQVYDAGDTNIGKVIGSLGMYDMYDQHNNKIMQFFNAGIPSRNHERFGAGDDLVHIPGHITTDPLLYMQFIALPAFIKILFSK